MKFSIFYRELFNAFENSLNEFSSTCILNCVEHYQLTLYFDKNNKLFNNGANYIEVIFFVKLTLS